MLRILFALAASTFALCQSLQAQQPEHSTLPISVRVTPIALGWASGASGTGIIPGGVAGGYWLSKSLEIGLTGRFWSASASFDSCSVTDSDCTLTANTETRAAYLDIALYPLGMRQLFVVAGGGLAILREQLPAGLVIFESRSTRFALLLAIGSDLPVAHNIFITPSFELQRIFQAEDALETSSDWILELGLGLTVG